jgi:hypothetical protein
MIISCMRIPAGLLAVAAACGLAGCASVGKVTLNPSIGIGFPL